MNKIDETKQYLKKAYSSLPPDFALRDVRFAVNQAMQKLEQYETKLNRRETVYKQTEKDYTEERQQWLNPLDTKNRIDIIDKMIKEEEKKIADIAAARKPNESLLE